MAALRMIESIPWPPFAATLGRPPTFSMETPNFSGPQVIKAASDGEPSRWERFAP